MNNSYKYIPAIFKQFKGGMEAHQPVKGRNPGVKIVIFVDFNGIHNLICTKPLPITLNGY